MAQIFSIPLYVPDMTSGEAVTGYEVQSAAPSPSAPDTYGAFTDIAGSPFTSNINIVDVAGNYTTAYRVRPLRTVKVGGTTYTIDTPWSKPFTASQSLYDYIFTRSLLPSLRVTYLGDVGIAQTNGTNLMETTGAGQGVWIPDGSTTRFQLQYVLNDDPIRVLDDSYTLVQQPNGGAAVTLQPNVDYFVDVRNAVVTFTTPPQSTDYLRFDFRRVDFVNEDLLLALKTGVNSLSMYGKNGFQTNTSYNLVTLNQTLTSPDLAEIICKASILRMHEGFTNAQMRAMTSWRDGNSSADPMPDRALEFVVEKLQITESSLRRDINTFIRGTTAPIGRGEFDMFWDLSQLTPLTSGMFAAIPGGSYGTVGAGLGVAMWPWYL